MDEMKHMKNFRPRREYQVKTLMSFFSIDYDSMFKWGLILANQNLHLMKIKLIQ